MVENKAMKSRMVAILLVFMMIFLVGCEMLQQKISDAEKLIQAKNPFVGDAVADGKILELLNLDANIGSYTFELNTTTEPYGMKINFNDLVMDTAQIDQKMKDYAVMIFALTGNLEIIQWVYTVDNNQKIVEVSRDLLQQETGINIDAIAQTQEAIQAQLDRFKIVLE